MRHVIDSSEVLGSVETQQGVCEVCAAANASYDEDSARLEVRLNAFLRTTDLRTKEQRLAADWLPKTETVVETVGPDETAATARDIFHRWARKVRAAIPAPAPH